MVGVAGGANTEPKTTLHDQKTPAAFLIARITLYRWDLAERAPDLQSAQVLA